MKKTEKGQNFIKDVQKKSQNHFKQCLKPQVGNYIVPQFSTKKEIVYRVGQILQKHW